MLHLISQSPVPLAVLGRIAEGDAVVFLENSVLNLLQAGPLAGSLLALLPHNRLCVLQDDLAIRGIAPSALLSGLEVINYAALVGLTVSHAQIQSWS
ncbi:MAG: sulfurtransferase complex subunit TusB [Methylococcales bacterium]|nr:sulfurtransferase complex subunit TusB [Methylococcales bacterium]